MPLAPSLGISRPLSASRALSRYLAPYFGISRPLSASRTRFRHLAPSLGLSRPLSTPRALSRPLEPLSRAPKKTRHRKRKICPYARYILEPRNWVLWCARWLVEWWSAQLSGEFWLAEKRVSPRCGKELERPVRLLAGGATWRALCDLGHTLHATGLERLPRFIHGKRSRQKIPSRLDATCSHGNRCYCRGEKH